MNKVVLPVKIGDYTLPVQSEYSGSLSDLDVDSGRNINDGVMVRNRIRSEIHKLEFSYDLMTYEEAKPILNAIEPKEFNVTFFSLEKGKMITRKMFCGDKTYSYTAAIPNGKTDFEIVVKDLKFNLIEM